MIPASDAFKAANAKLNKVPIYLFEIEGYSKAFSNADLGAFSTIPFSNQLGLLSSPTTSSAWIEDAQNPTYNYGTGSATGPQSGTISRWSSNSLLSHTLPGILHFYNATGAYAAPGSDNPLAIPRSTLTAVVVKVDVVIELPAGGLEPAWVIEASADGGSNWHTVGSYFTSGAYSASLDITSLIGSIATFDFSQVQVRFYPNESLTEFHSPPGTTGSVHSVSLSFGYNSSIPTATAYPWLIAVDDHLLTINDLDGGADLADLIVHVQDRGNLITADFPGFVFEGKQIHFRAGWGHFDFTLGMPVSDLAVSDFVTLFTGKIDAVESDNGNTEYVFTCPDVRTELTKTIYTVGDDGFPTDSNHPRTLLGHPLDILLASLETEVGLAVSDVDVAKIVSYRDTIYDGLEFEFTITSPPVAKDFIENEIMKPLGAYIWPNNLGQVTVNFYYPLSVVPVIDFNRDNLVEIPIPGPADLINQISVRMDYDTSDNATTETVRTDAASVAKFGLYGNHIIEAKGLRSGLQGILIGALTAWLIFLRYGFKQLMFGSSNSGNGNANPINALWSCCLVEPGDIVTLTHPQVPDRNVGVMGVTAKTFVVMDRTWQFFECLVQLKLLEVDLSKFKQYLIAPNGEADYTGAGVTDQGKYMFFANDSDQYSNGNPANTLC